MPHRGEALTNPADTNSSLVSPDGAVFLGPESESTQLAEDALRKCGSCLLNRVAGFRRIGHRETTVCPGMYLAELGLSRAAPDTRIIKAFAQTASACDVSHPSVVQIVSSSRAKRDYPSLSDANARDRLADLLQ